MSISALPGSISGMGLRYEGKVANQNILDAIEYSKSLEGCSRLYRLVAHYCLHGEVLGPRSRSDLRCYTLPSQAGSYESLLVILPVLAQDIPVFADAYKASLDWFISGVMRFIKDKLSGQSDMNGFIEHITDRAKDDHELNTLLVNGLVKANGDLAAVHDKLIETLPSLAAGARQHMSKAVTPVGSSCTKMSQFHELDQPVEITEPEALAIRSRDQLVAGNPNSFLIRRFHSISVDTGSCSIEVDGIDGLLNGKVSDIALSEPGNPYTTALNTHEPLQVRARPLLHDNKIHKLFITEPE